MKTDNSLSRRELLKKLGVYTFAFPYILQASTPKNSKAHIVIVGGGIGGASAAKYLRLLNPYVKITLIEPNKEYIFCPGSNEILPGWQSVTDLTVTYNTLKTRYNTEVISDYATTIDYSKKRLSLAKGGYVDFDKLIVSPGPTYDYEAIEGYSLELAKSRFPAAWHVSPQTLLLKKQINALPKGGTVIISIPKAPYRCPPAPYERATFIAHMLKKSDKSAKVIIVDSQENFVFENIYTYYWKQHFGYGKTDAILQRIKPSEGGHIVKLDPSTATLYAKNGEKFHADVLNIIPPHKASHFTFHNNLNEGKWSPVSYQDYQSTKHKDIYIIGDTIDSDPMPKTGYIASNQARIVAQAIDDELHGVAPRTPFIVNDCIAMVEPNFGMTLSEIFRYDGVHKRLKSRSYIPSVDKNRYQQKMLGTLAKDWQENFRRSVFS